jgi:hypothetical protein
VHPSPSTPARIAAGVLAALAILAIALAGARRLHRSTGAAPRSKRLHPRFAVTAIADHFQRGNIHTHSTRSDGTAPLADMVGWYRDHGYQFLAMTEHHFRLDPAELEPLSGPGFVVIPGEEVTDFWGEHPLHANALCARQTVPSREHFERADQGLSTMLAEIGAQGGVPLVNHPNYGWALEADDLARGASGRYLLEIWSGLPAVHAQGDAGHRSEEAIWDDVLASDPDAIPIAVDDAHGLHEGPGGSDALPGRGWVETFGDETTVGAICAALAEGRLYASNGPSLERLEVQGDTFLVATKDAGASVDFLDERGVLLARVRAAEAPARGDVRELRYQLTGYEKLVRARLADGQGRHAWTPAYRVGDNP